MALNDRSAFTAAVSSSCSAVAYACGRVYNTGWSAAHCRSGRVVATAALERDCIGVVDCLGEVGCCHIVRMLCGLEIPSCHQYCVLRCHQPFLRLCCSLRVGHCHEEASNVLRGRDTAAARTNGHSCVQLLHALAAP